MRILFRFAGLLLLAAAFAALIVDGTRSIAAGALEMLPLDRTMAAVSPDGFAKIHALIVQKSPTLWDSAILPILQMPSWLVLGALGLVLVALTRRRAPKIGYSRR